jgi:hypothetical protein
MEKLQINDLTIWLEQDGLHIQHKSGAAVHVGLAKLHAWAIRQIRGIFS